MYKSHRLVFLSHWKSYLAQAIAIIISSIIVFCYCYVLIILDSCVISEGVDIYKLDLKNEVKSICSFLGIGYQNYFKNKTGLIIQVTFEFLLSLIPVTIFLFTQRPHDCFKCLGKNPSAGNYSIF
jgi:hypothetical protein